MGRILTKALVCLCPHINFGYRTGENKFCFVIVWLIFGTSYK